MKRTHYTSPPAAAIAAAFNVSIETAHLARRIIRGEAGPLASSPATAAWERACYNSPRQTDRILHALNSILGCHGVEAFCTENDPYHAIAEYLNTGDTYSPTLLFRHDTGTFRLTSWGDFYERNEKRLGLRSF